MKQSDHQSTEGVLPSKTLVAERYEIIKFLGGGAMGNVYQAFDHSLQSKSVAIKILHYEHSRNEKLTRRFLEELGHTHNISHPNVVRTYDFGSDRGSLYFTMEYVPGVTLDNYEPLRQFNEELLENILIQICQGLAAIHRAEIVHRDMKHGNIIILPDASLKIADFGIARPETSNLTVDREIAGSVDYLAPEIWKGGAIRTAVDFYALGCILYELLVGKLPFENDEIHRTIWGHIFSEPPEPGELLKGLPLWLNTLTCWLLAKDPEHRPHSAEEVIQFIKHPERNEIAPIHKGSKGYASAVPFDKEEAERMLQNVFLPSPEHRLIVDRKKGLFARIFGFFRLLFLLLLLFIVSGLYIVRNYPSAASLLRSQLLTHIPESQISSSRWVKFLLSPTTNPGQRTDSQTKGNINTSSHAYSDKIVSLAFAKGGITSLRTLLASPLEAGIDFSIQQGEESMIFAAITEITDRSQIAQEAFSRTPKIDSESLHTALLQLESNIEAQRLLTSSALLHARLQSIETIGSEFSDASPEQRHVFRKTLSKRRLEIKKVLSDINTVKKDAILRLKRWIRFAHKIEKLDPFAVAATLADKDKQIAREFKKYAPLYNQKDSELELTLKSMVSMFDPKYTPKDPSKAKRQKAARKLKKSAQRLIIRRLAGLLHAIVAVRELEYVLEQDLEIVTTEEMLIAAFPRPRTREEASFLAKLKRERTELLKKNAHFKSQHNEQHIQTLRLILHLTQLDL
jgi:serine/threonine protein kinase